METNMKTSMESNNNSSDLIKIINPNINYTNSLLALFNKKSNNKSSDYNKKYNNDKYISLDYIKKQIQELEKYNNI